MTWQHAIVVGTCLASWPLLLWLIGKHTIEMLRETFGHSASVSSVWHIWPPDGVDVEEIAKVIVRLEGAER